MRGAVVLACVSIFLQPSLQPQDTPIRSVRVSLKAKPDAKVQVVIETSATVRCWNPQLGCSHPAKPALACFTIQTSRTILKAWGKRG